MFLIVSKTSPKLLQEHFFLLRKTKLYYTCILWPKLNQQCWASVKIFLRSRPAFCQAVKYSQGLGWLIWWMVRCYLGIVLHCTNIAIDYNSTTHWTRYSCMSFFFFSFSLTYQWLLGKIHQRSLWLGCGWSDKIQVLKK